MDLFKQNIITLSSQLENLPSNEEKYSFIMSLAGEVFSIPHPVPEMFQKVRGCQSEMYISQDENGTIEIYSDALLSKGLAALLLRCLSGLAPLDIVQCSFEDLQILNLSQILSPGRLNGFESLFSSIKLLIINNYRKNPSFT